MIPNVCESIINSVRRARTSSDIVLRSTPIPDKRLIGCWISRQWSNGLTITEQTAMQSSVVYACVRILAETIASLPLQIFERLPDGIEVTVTLCHQTGEDAEKANRPKIWERLGELGKWAESQPCALPADLASYVKLTFVGKYAVTTFVSTRPRLSLPMAVKVFVPSTSETFVRANV